MSALANSLAEQFRKYAGELPGAGKPRVVELRKQAFSQFEARGLPTVKLEDWKYTDIRALRDMSYIALGEAHNLDTGSVDFSSLPLPEFTPHVAIFLDGEFCPRLSTLDSLPHGVTLSTIGALLHEGSTTIIDHMASNEAAFPALNSALLSDGVLIDLAPDTLLEEPIHVIFLNQPADAPKLNTARLIVNGRRNSRCVIVESHYSLEGSQGMTNALTEIEAHDGACAVHYRVQIDEPATHHIGNVFATVGKDATVETYSFAFGGGITRIDVNADLVGPGGNIVMNGLFMVNENQHIDHHTRVRHRVGRTYSNENYKGIADGNGRGVFNGKILVEQGAQKIEALQSSKNLLLSDGAEIDTKPELEIYADDVKCAHGATVGQLDEDAFFYLRSRGIDEQTTRS
ncbi:MAG: Fe-S cluster assembly protein SufD, partial [Gammaproteobacteria bacterium]|nr:Fe-S cluster assembly protein SufD [Gammaproteobacteria bacterium]